MVQVICGNNTYAVEEKYSSIVADFEKNNGDLAIEKYDASNIGLDALLSTIQALPFLSAKKMVVVNDFMDSKEIAENIQSILEAASDTTELIFKAHAIDKRLAAYKQLKQLPGFCELNNLEFYELVDWATTLSGRVGLNISKELVRHIVERVGENQQLLSKEIEKLALYSSNPSHEDIDMLIQKSSQTSVFDLLEAVFNGRTKQALEMYEDQRKQRVEPQAILAMIYWQVNILALVVSGKNDNSRELAQRAKISPFVLQKAATIAKRVGGQVKLRSLIQMLVDLDLKLKTESINADDAVKNLLLKIVHQQN